MTRRARNELAPETGRRALVGTVATAAGFALALGAWLGAAGFATSGFAFSVTPRQAVPVVGVFFLAYVALGLALVLWRLIFGRGRRRWKAIGQRLVQAMATVTSWVLLIVTFLPMKGSEAFVRSGRLTTLQLNVIGLAAILVVGVVLGLAIGFLVGRILAVLRRRLTSGGMKAVGTVAAVAALVVVFVGPSVRAPRQADIQAAVPGFPRVAIIGVDGCDWEKLEPLIASGKVPTFARLVENGCYGPLLSLDELISPRIWTTIATGKDPEKHGIYDFVNERGVPVNATMVRAAPVWRIASAGGATVAVVGWYVTWPAERVHGVLISDRLHSLMRGPVQMLHSLTGTPTNARLESFGHFSFDPGYKAYSPSDKRYQQNRIVDEPLRWGYLRDLIYSTLARWLLPVYKPDFTAMYFRGVDFVQHFFWKYSDPEPFGDVSPEDEEAYGEVIGNYYVYQDSILEELLRALGDDVNVMVVSDHGFRPRLEIDPKRPQLTGMHDRRGVFIASGPAFKATGYLEGATVYDIAPTALAVMGLPVAEDMDGRVLTETIRESHLEVFPLRSTPSYEPALGRVESELDSTMDESIREQLRSLGYIE